MNFQSDLSNAGGLTCFFLFHVFDNDPRSDPGAYSRGQSAFLKSSVPDKSRVTFIGVGGFIILPENDILMDFSALGGSYLR
jgi:hypothetical protein